MSTNVLRQCEALEGLADIPSSSIPLVVTSPPWGQTPTFGGHCFDFEPVATELWRVMKPGGVVCWHYQDQIEDGSESCEHCHQLLHFRRLEFRLHQTMTIGLSGDTNFDPLRPVLIPTPSMLSCYRFLPPLSGSFSIFTSGSGWVLSGSVLANLDRIKPLLRFSRKR